MVEFAKARSEERESRIFGIHGGVCFVDQFEDSRLIYLIFFFLIDVAYESGKVFPTHKKNRKWESLNLAAVMHDNGLSLSLPSPQEPYIITIVFRRLYKPPKAFTREADFRK